MQKAPKAKLRKLSGLKPEPPSVKVDRNKVRKEYEQKYLARYKSPKTSGLKPEPPSVKVDRNKVRKEYEQKYLARYKSPKSSIRKSSGLKPDADLGRLNLGKHVTTKRDELLAERKAYERKFLSRYKAPKAKQQESSGLYKPEPPRIKVDRNKVRKEYEKKFLSRYKAPKSKRQESSGLYKPEPPRIKVDRNKVRKEYEKSFSHVTRHQNQSDRNHPVYTNQNHQELKLIEIKYERNTKKVSLTLQGTKSKATGIIRSIQTRTTKN